MDLSNWRLDSLITADLMFKNNRALRSLNCKGWGMANVTSMSSMFDTIDFCVETNGLSTWDVSNVTNMNNMFINNKQNSGIFIEGWDVGNVTNMNRMLYDCDQFNRNLENWDIVNVSNFNGFMQVATGLSTENYDKLLNGWENTLNAAYPLGVGYPHNININFDISKYTIEGVDARQRLIDNFGWTITDGGQTANANLIIDITTNDTFTIPTNITESYNYRVVTSDGQDLQNNTSDTTITFQNPGTYRLKITGVFPSIYFNNSGDKSKIIDIVNWGVGDWTSFENSFWGCENLTNITATDAPNLTNVLAMGSMFRDCLNLVSIDVSNWDLTNVTQLANGYYFGMFYGCTNLITIDVSNWNTTNVVTMQGLFRLCTNLTTLDVSNWNTISLANARMLFDGCSNLSVIDVSNWNVQSIVFLRNAFANTGALNLDLSNWNTASLVTIQYMLSNNQQMNAVLDLSNWNVSGVTNFLYCLGVNNNSLTTFKSLANWDINQGTNFNELMRGTKFETPTDYDNTLISWANQVPQPNEVINFGQNQYTIGSAGETARNTLINTYGWTIIDAGGI